MTLQQLRYAIEVADKGSFTEAARTLFIAQPSLTKAIHELEKEMHIVIFYRNRKGVVITNEGDEFLAYARQVLTQTALLEEKYLHTAMHETRFSVSTQHYSFAVNAFADLIREFGENRYDFTLRETQTYEIIEDVSRLKSEIGILYLSSANEEVLTKLIRKNGLVFNELFSAQPHVFISSHHPLAHRKKLSLKDLEPYPYLSFEQGNNNSFYFSEEILSTLDCRKNVKVRDRATLFSLCGGIDGYTVSSGIISKELSGVDIIAIPLDIKDTMHIGTITRSGAVLSPYGDSYMEALKKYIRNDL
ncbi:MAG: LysR family transcriptional regulator [Butyrivibrio sp.]|jgi:DNA-binding transcriptional LysR family regulator|nr:LysR family transcriptional regulator [Butyrivibrio sp.]